MAWRSWYGALYAEDVIRLTPRLTLSLGFRDEFTTGWNEAHGRASNYTYPNGVISSQPTVGTSVFTVNNAKFLPQPRIGLAWSPFTTQAARSFARASACTTICRMRWATAPIRTLHLIRPIVCRPCRFHRCPSSIGSDSRDCETRARRSPAGSANADVDFLVAACQQAMTANTSLTVGYVGRMAIMNCSAWTRMSRSR